MSAEWLIEDGIGETRAVLIRDGAPVAYRTERPGLRHGARALARVVRLEGARAFFSLDGEDVLLDPAPRGLVEGGTVMVEVRREAIAEPGRARLARVALTAEALPKPGATFAERADAPIRRVAARGPSGDDALEAAGWSEAIEQARTGSIVFPGGVLTLTRTPAFLAVDVDGAGSADELAAAAALALARAFVRFDLGGSIVVDFPSLAGRAPRAAVGEILDTHLPKPFERTAMNGFGLLQIVRPKLRPSLLDHVQDRVGTAALALLRAGERAIGAGTLTLTAAPAVWDWLRARPALTAELARRIGRAVALAVDPALPISAGHA